MTNEAIVRGRQWARECFIVKSLFKRVDPGVIHTRPSWRQKEGLLNGETKRPFPRPVLSGQPLSDLHLNAAVPFSPDGLPVLIQFKQRSITHSYITKCSGSTTNKALYLYINFNHTAFSILKVLICVLSYVNALYCKIVASSFNHETSKMNSGVSSGKNE
ncbi:hypothetical protein CEXT_450141 [Caerostris extrusa]|uniref:Uncharacterized protein n=1 Tax=Caerostris extrusa TaxID=172846 RepID=A0AAV4XRC2_CAEEX|nr:hypothetical protein CEXT_450141 [Caerostris extrusa]